MGEHYEPFVTVTDPTVIYVHRTHNGWWQVRERDARVICSSRDEQRARRVAERLQTAADNLDRHFPKRGPCLLCGVPGEDQRHRVVDAVADRARAGDGVVAIAEDYGVPPQAVLAAWVWTALLRRVCARKAPGVPVDGLPGVGAPRVPGSTETGRREAMGR